MASALQLIGGSVPKGLESHTKERKEIRIIDIVRKENNMGCRWETTHDCQFCVLDCPERDTSINIEALEQMASVPTPRQRDEIDEWLEKGCHIYAGACSSVESLKYSTAREVAEKLWKKEDVIEKAKEEFIEQACEWLKFNLQDYAGEDSCRNSVPFDKDVFDAFRKAMKEEL